MTDHKEVMRIVRDLVRDYEAGEMGDLKSYVRPLRAALAETGGAEPARPFCYIYEFDLGWATHRSFYPENVNGVGPSRSIPVYAHPPATPQGAERASVADYEEVLADHRRLVREMDVLLNGDGAAKQASLCDIVAQVARTKRITPQVKMIGLTREQHCRLTNCVWATYSSDHIGRAQLLALLGEWPATPQEPGASGVGVIETAG